MLRKIPPALEALKKHDQFVLWSPVARPGSNRMDKVPISHLTAARCDAHDPRNWMSADTAEMMVAAYGEKFGIGFVFTANDPLFFLDFDECLRPDGSGWTNAALSVLGRFPGAAVEISLSGRGLHAIGCGSVPLHSCDNKQLGVSLYTDKRFVALTGTGIIGSASIDHTAALMALVSEYFTPAVKVSADWTTEPIPEWNGYDDDDLLVKKALRAQSAGGVFGGKCTFKDLWEADEKTLTKSYPDVEGNRAYDASSADAALAQHLAFWTGKNCERILALMWRSKLSRDKWHREDYLARTISKAVALQKSVYTAGALKKIEPQPTKGPRKSTGYQYQTVDLQLEHFSGCVYIQEFHRVFTPSGALLRADQFNATYGGYVFQLDSIGDKTTRKAWEAFTESQALRWPKADSKCFRPELPTGVLVKEEGRTLVNTYVPIDIPGKNGDPAPFLNHLDKLLPNATDKKILLAYMAACTQHRGVKFQWAPLLQGTEGNGKTLFTRCVAFAIGQRYTHMPLAGEISEKFNEWLFEKLFIGVEDVYVPSHRQEIIETLKPMITNDRHAMRAMQQGQVMGDNRANFMLNCNSKDGLRKNRNDRRFCVFFTAQQQKSDIIRDGMGGDYFPRLYKWLRDGGYAIVSRYLSTYRIPDELNPATLCHRAPETSSTAEAITAGLGAIEQEILEAVEEGRSGFSGGWISSVAVERLLQTMRAARSIPHNKRRELLQNLGYDWHPGLANGRVNNPILIDDGKKPVLFIQSGHIHRNLTQPAEISRQYQTAQGVPPATNLGPFQKNA